ncbi:O-antigen ligase family protein [Desulforhopalus sp. 52FAK]
MAQLSQHLTNNKDTRIDKLYRLNPSAIWHSFWEDKFAFWMCCAYLFFEYIRPQAIWPVFAVYPYWARTFILLAFIGWFIDAERQFVWTKFTTGVFAYLLLIILSSYNAYWPEISHEKFMDFFNWVVVFFVLSQTVTTRKRFYILLLIFMLASFKLSLFGAKVFAMRGFAFTRWGIAGPEGYFQNPGEYAIQMLMFAPLALFFIQGIRKYLKRWQANVLYLMPITAALTIIGTNTRGGQLALAVQILTLIMTTKKWFKMLIIIACISVIGFQLLPDKQKARFESSGKDGTSVQRLLYWKHGWQMIKEHPLLGVGYMNFPAYYTKHHSDDLVLEMLRDRGAELPHNIFIQVGTDTGFSGLFVIILLMFFSVLSMKKISTDCKMSGDQFLTSISKGMILSFIGFVVAGQFVTVMYYPFFWVYLVFVSAIVTLRNKEAARGASSIGVSP